MPKFKRKPVVVEAIQFRYNSPDDNNYHDINFMIGASDVMRYLDKRGELIVGSFLCKNGAWIIKDDISGEFYPCRPGIFEKTYEPVEEV